jgi:hypothetical protein
MTTKAKVGVTSSSCFDPKYLPKALEASPKEPTFANPQSAEVAKSDPTLAPKSSREFSFFKDSEHRMKIPENGGILSMSPTWVLGL